MDSKTAIDHMAEHMARKAAKRKGTASEMWVDGFKVAIIENARSPLPADADLIAALAHIEAALASEATPTLAVAGEE